MWDTLQLTHEDTTDVKRSKINILTHEYELFRMNTNENHRVCALLFATKTFIDFIVNNKKCVLLNCITIDAELFFEIKILNAHIVI